MKKTEKLVFMLMIILCLCIIMPHNWVTASVSSEVGSVTADQPAAGDLTTTIGKILGFLQVAAGLTSIIIIAFTGFNYIVATPNVKEEMKNKMLPIVIGIVLVFGAVSISKFIVGSIEGTTSTQEDSAIHPAHGPYAP